MNPVYLSAFVILASALLFIVGALLLAVAARHWVVAINEITIYRINRSRVNAQEDTIRSAEEAVDELRGHSERMASEPEYPSDRDLRRAAFEQTMDELGVEGVEMPEHYVTTEDNSLREPSTNGHSEAIFPDSLYNEQIAER